jgi:hypothetical protein
MSFRSLISMIEFSFASVSAWGLSAGIIILSSPTHSKAVASSDDWGV